MPCILFAAVIYAALKLGLLWHRARIADVVEVGVRHCLSCSDASAPCAVGREDEPTGRRRGTLVVVCLLVSDTPLEGAPDRWWFEFDDLPCD